jgi:CheY-like chemotaxis protein
MHFDRIVVLIVEDDVLIRMAMASQLHDAGFDVVEAMSAADAIRILEKDTSIDALVSDISMPGAMDGISLVHSVHDRWPAIKLIVASGSSNATSSDLPTGCRYLAKPYEVRQLIATLRGLVCGYAF